MAKQIIQQPGKNEIGLFRSYLENRIGTIKKKLEEIKDEQILEIFKTRGVIASALLSNVGRRALKMVAELDMELCSNMLKLCKDAETYVVSEVQKIKQETNENIFKIRAQEYDSLSAQRCRKLNIPDEEKGMLMYAFMLSQYKPKVPDNEEFASLCKSVENTKESRKLLENLVRKEYLAKGDADYALKKLMEIEAHAPSEKGVDVKTTDVEDEFERLEFTEQFKESLKVRFVEISAVVKKEIALKLVEHNPGLAKIERKEFEKYLAALNHYVATNKNAEEEIEKNVSEFSNPNRIEYIIKSASLAPAPQIQVTAEQMHELAFRNAGIDFKVVDVLITNGMKIQKKVIGGAYIPSKFVLNTNLDSYYKIVGDTKENRREVERTFEWLIGQGAIIHHKKKGKSLKESVVSINPHINEIKFEALAQYMRDKLGYRNGN
jgi:hypothetical protein